MKTEPNDPINSIVEDVTHGMSEVITRDCTNFGLSKLEYFAGQAMGAMLANPNGGKSEIILAILSVSYAKALINALNEEKE
jgi:hypothetical protein